MSSRFGWNQQDDSSHLGAKWKQIFDLIHYLDHIVRNRVAAKPIQTLQQDHLEAVILVHHPKWSCSNKHMIITENGRLGLVPESAKKGDAIFLLVGADVLFVLYPTDQAAWKLGNHCYIQGIMDGEAWDESKCVDMVLD